MLGISQLGGTRKRAIRRILAHFADRGWRDPDMTAIRIVEQLESGDKSPDHLAQIPSATFLTMNGTTRSAVADALADLTDI